MCFLLDFLPLCMSILLFVPDVTPFVMTEGTGNVDKVNEVGGIFTLLSGRLLADDSGDQPLCLFFGGAAFACGPGR